MNKKYKLKNKQRFNEVIQSGKKLKNKNYVVYFLPDFELKVGITIGKKICNAPKRNYHRRVIRSICMKDIDKFPTVNLVIIGRDNLQKASYEDKTQSLMSLIERIKCE